MRISWPMTGVGLFLVLLGLLAPAGAQPRLALIIDDVGNDYAAAQKVLTLPKGVTVSILPQLHNSARIARQAHAQGREVMLHLPMQAMNNKRLGPGGLTQAQTREQLQQTLRENLLSVPFAAGVNNHMGSLLTRDPKRMAQIMDVLREQGELYFVDSRTSADTLAEQMAQANGLRHARRDVFLDHQREPAYIRSQLKRALQLARMRGSAIAIAHPYPQTLTVLSEVLPELQAQGIALIPVSQVITHQRKPCSWHASWSPLLKVVKNSKPSPSSTCCAEPVLR